MLRVIHSALLVSLFLLGPAALGGQEAEAGTVVHPGQSLQVFLLTTEQGDLVWERFGHNALWVRDRETGEGEAYNWGLFSFFQEGFWLRLARGTMLYSMGPDDPMAMIEEARYFDRRVWLQELALTPAQKLELLAFVQLNALPQNRDYRYDYYRDNCSTRVRDALDRVLAGGLKEISGSVVTPYSFRWHTRRLLGDRPPAYLGIQFVLGLEAERPITGWEEMFLPLRLMDWVREVEVPDGQGGTRPLVLWEEEVLPSGRPPVPVAPPFALPWFLLAGVLWGGGILLLARGGARGAGWVRRSLLAVLAGGWTLVAAFSGTVLLAAWIFTDHFFWSRNMNLLQVNPFFLPIPVAFLLFLWRGSFPRWGRDMAAALAVVALVGSCMQLLPGLRQHNGEILAVTLPINLSLWLAAHWVLNGSRAQASKAGEDGVAAREDGVAAEEGPAHGGSGG